MAILPVDPSSISPVGGSEWAVEGVGEVGPVDQPTQGSSGEGFGGMLSNAISSLEGTQTEAAKASQALVSGTATDPTEVVMAVEKARLAMQLASQVRNKAVEAYSEIFRTQV